MDYRTWAVVCLFALLLAISCSNTRQADARGRLIDYVQARFEGVLYEYLPAVDLTELLPNTEFRTRSGDSVRASDLAVVGRIADVVKGKGFLATGDATNGKVTTFDDPRARWRTLELLIEVERSLGPTNPGASVHVGFTVGSGADFEVLRLGFLQLNRVVLFLVDHSPVFSYDESLWAMVADGRSLTIVDETGSLQMPFAEKETADRLLKTHVDTLSELTAASEAPRRMVDTAQRKRSGF